MLPVSHTDALKALRRAWSGSWCRHVYGNARWPLQVIRLGGLAYKSPQKKLFRALGGERLR